MSKILSICLFLSFSGLIEASFNYSFQDYPQSSFYGSFYREKDPLIFYHLEEDKVGFEFGDSSLECPNFKDISSSGSSVSESNTLDDCSIRNERPMQDQGGCDVKAVLKEVIQHVKKNQVKPIELDSETDKKLYNFSKARITRTKRNGLRALGSGQGIKKVELPLKD